MREGDRVLVVWDNGRRQFGDIKAINHAMRFSERGGVRLQTYTIRCQDGQERPAHAWHIKTVINDNRRRKSNVR